MYNTFIKPPKTSESKCTLNFTINSKSEILHKNEIINLIEADKEGFLEPIAKLKYIIFSKDKSFAVWELCTAKYSKKFKGKPFKTFAFIEDSQDHTQDSDNEEEIISFF